MSTYKYVLFSYQHVRGMYMYMTRFVCANLKCSETGQLSSRGLFLVRVGQRSAATLELQNPVLHLSWASGKFKLMSGPVMSWQEPGARLDPRRTSDTSQKVP